MTSLPLVQCPATFCPLFAAHGSPWTGVKNGTCIGTECSWHRKSECQGKETAFEVIFGGFWDDKTSGAAKPPCKFEAACQWQRELGDVPCPPRAAIMHGVDPVVAGYS